MLTKTFAQKHDSEKVNFDHLAVNSPQSTFLNREIGVVSGASAPQPSDQCPLYSYKKEKQDNGGHKHKFCLFFVLLVCLVVPYFFQMVWGVCYLKADT